MVIFLKKEQKEKESLYGGFLVTWISRFWSCDDNGICNYAEVCLRTPATVHLHDWFQQATARR